MHIIRLVDLKLNCFGFLLKNSLLYTWLNFKSVALAQAQNTPSHSQLYVLDRTVQNKVSIHTLQVQTYFSFCLVQCMQVSQCRIKIG